MSVTAFPPSLSGDATAYRCPPIAAELKRTRIGKQQPERYEHAVLLGGKVRKRSCGRPTALPRPLVPTARAGKQVGALSVR